MAVLNFADRVYLNSQEVDRVYLGGAQVWPPISDANLYSLLDAASLPPFEKQTIGSGWFPYAINEIDTEIVIGYNSQWAIRAIKVGTGQDTFGGNIGFTINNLEIGELYRVTADCRTLNATQDGPGRGFLRTRQGATWQAQGYFDIENYAWETHSFTCRPAQTSADILFFPSWKDGGIGSTTGDSCIIDNIFIEKIS